MNSQKIFIADINDVKKRVKELESRSSDSKSRLAPILKKLWNPERHLQIVSQDTNFDNLRKNFPQFEKVIEYFENSIICSARLEVSLQIPPILLLGDPGLGKTYFVSEFAELINLPFFEISLATVTATFGLSGGNIQWAEGSTGFIANSLAESKVANPIILIDEIDKASPSRQYNPMNIFYTLLESHTAERFKDEALEFKLDASKVIWIATGNYIENIPDPILSRMRIFNIEQPDKNSMKTIVQCIYEHLIFNKPYGKLLDSVLDAAIIERLSVESPRAAKRAIEIGAFSAIRQERRYLILDDLPMLAKKRNRVGFI